MSGTLDKSFVNTFDWIMSTMTDQQEAHISANTRVHEQQNSPPDFGPGGLFHHVEEEGQWSDRHLIAGQGWLSGRDGFFDLGGGFFYPTMVDDT